VEDAWQGFAQQAFQEFQKSPGSKKSPSSMLNDIKEQDSKLDDIKERDDGSSASITG
jgi:hypothetical protein